MVGFFLEETVARACSPGGACTAADLLYFRKEPVPWKEVATIAERLPSRQRVREARGRTLRSVHSDLYSLGCVLHELLTGRRPFSGATVFALARQHEELEPTLLRELRPDVDPALERLVLDLLENVPTAAPPTETPPPDKNRPQQAADLLSRQVEKSGCSLGFDHARTLDVRLELADVLCGGASTSGPPPPTKVWWATWPPATAGIPSRCCAARSACCTWARATPPRPTASYQTC